MSDERITNTNDDTGDIIFAHVDPVDVDRAIRFVSEFERRYPKVRELAELYGVRPRTQDEV